MVNITATPERKFHAPGGELFRKQRRTCRGLASAKTDYGFTVLTFHPVNTYPGLGSGVGGTNVPPYVQDMGVPFASPSQVNAILFPEHTGA